MDELVQFREKQYFETCRLGSLIGPPTIGPFATCKSFLRIVQQFRSHRWIVYYYCGLLSYFIVIKNSIGDSDSWFGFNTDCLRNLTTVMVEHESLTTVMVEHESLTTWLVVPLVFSLFWKRQVFLFKVISDLRRCPLNTKWKGLLCVRNGAVEYKFVVIPSW